jgi:putative ABC transport system substrate-binding protein
MERRTFLGVIASGLLAAPLGAEAQKAGRTAHVGVLEYGYAEPAFRSRFGDHLQKLGWTEGQNIILEWRFADQNAERLSTFAIELVRLKLDVIVVVTAIGLKAVKQLTETIPIVVMQHADLVGAGYARSLARPGGNVTGLLTLGPELYEKQLQLLRETIPNMSRLATLVNPDNPGWQAGRMSEAASALKMRLQIVEVRNASDFEPAFSAMAQAHAQGLVVMRDVIFFQHRTKIAALAAQYRLPAMYGLKEHVEAGGLISYGFDRGDMLRRTASYVDKILRGAKPGDLPIEQPTKFQLFVNLKTAKALGLTIPQSLLLRADQVIE